MAAARRSSFPLRLFSQELALLLRAGVPLLESLRSLREKETAVSIAATLDLLVDELMRGQPLSAAMRLVPRSFDPLFIAVVSASERTGQTEHGLTQHAAYMLWVERLRDKLVAASIYPATLLVAGTAVLMFLILFVVPRFAGILESGGGDLPMASRALLALGHVGDAHPWLSVSAAVATLLSPVVVFRDPGCRAWLGALMWRLPAIGPKLRLLALARLYRTSSMLLGAGVAAVGALERSRDVVALPLRGRLDAAIRSVQRGERFSSAMEHAQLSTPVALRMLRVGEQTGELGRMLGEAAAFHDEELTRLTELITRVVNPALMLLMGGVIGAVVVLMYLPIFQLAEQVQ